MGRTAGKPADLSKSRISPRPSRAFFWSFMDKYIFSSESVGEGHPDKVADTISDAVLDACLAQDKFSRVACETYVKSNMVIVGGEITTKAKLDFVKIARESIREIGYASNETPELMPAPIMFAHRLGRELTRIRKSGGAPWLRPDAKSQVSVIYEDNKPVGIANVVISTQHTPDVSHKDIESFCIESVIKKVLPVKLLNDKTEFLSLIHISEPTRLLSISY